MIETTAVAKNKPLIKYEDCARQYPMALHITRRVAHEYGYAIAVHGSMIRDLDLIAMPWTEEAKPTLDLIDAIALATSGFITSMPSHGGSWPICKPHGRKCWSIHLGGGPYIDLSVAVYIPRPEETSTQPPPEKSLLERFIKVVDATHPTE